ncbi:hypothetical protein KKG41_05190 [Patescibacteria group bacterium]|nr:hypothetical protein [Patescibacteria group bacterium]MBU1890931.1 hypothetical protein [Patescibacteria group bacterium]
MKVKVKYHKSPVKANILPESRYVCPWCWEISERAGRCQCGAELEKERMRIFFEYET